MATKSNVPWETQKGKMSSGGEGDLVKLEDGRSGGGWFILCLHIGSPRQGRWYARREDGSQWRISVARSSEYVLRHVWDRDRIYVGVRAFKGKAAPHQKERKLWLDVLSTGSDRANEIRDRISTRRMETQERRRSYGLFGGF